MDSTECNTNEDGVTIISSRQSKVRGNRTRRIIVREASDLQEDVTQLKSIIEKTKQGNTSTKSSRNAAVSLTKTISNFRRRRIILANGGE